MAIPNDIDFTAFDTLTAAQMDDLIENDKALAAGTALDNGAVTPDKRSGGFYGTLWDASALGTGTGKTISGIGFTPKAVIVLGHGFAAAAGTVSSTGYCFYNGSSYIQGNQTFGATTSAMRTTVSATAAFSSTTQSTTQFVGTITGFSSGTITVNITTNVGSDYCKFNILVFG